MTRFDRWMRVVGLGLAALMIAASASAQTYTELLSFNGNSAAGPETPLTQGIDGNLYGTTYFGGTGKCTGNGVGCGVAFKLTRSGQFRILYNFQTDGAAYPVNNLVLGINGNFYGMTNTGYGGIFELTPAGKFTTLHSFERSTDGAYPEGGLILGADGNFYGTTVEGGTPSNSCPSGCGTIFKITPAGSLTTIYSFCPQNYCPDGENPDGGLAEGIDGNFYGTTSQGGLYKQGTIFKVSPNGAFTLLYTFDGTSHLGGLVLGRDGNFYGEGSSFFYQFTPEGALTVLPGTLYSVYFPNPPIQGSDGNLYVTSSSGGSGFGNFVQLPLSGDPTDLYNFSGYPNDGSYPEAGVVQHTSGTFYGTTYAGGDAPCNYAATPGCGTVFSYDARLPPFVAFVRGMGRGGQQFGLLGQGLTGTTSVSVNGVAAAFTVQSDTLIVTSVPAGASSGYVTVNTPLGSLTSNAPFWVLP